MRKLVAVIAVICLVCIGIGFFQLKNRPEKTTSAETADSASTESADTEAYYQELLNAVPEVDYAAIYATHDPSEVIGTVDGRDITWSEYFRFFYDYANQIDEYMLTMTMYYGTTPAWTDVYDASTGTTFAQMPAIYAESDIKQYAAINGFASANGCVLSDENTENVTATLEASKLSACGENATDEAFKEALAKSYLTPELYRYLVSSSYLYKQMYTDLYGENGEKVSEENAVRYLQEKGYTSANHILFMTRDKSTGETVDEETVKAKKEQAEKIAEELQAIEDPAERQARFLQYKTELDEDTGKTAYPNGYTYTAGTMVTEFENAVNALGEHEVSAPVESSYGYHVIMRLPLSGDAVLEYDDDGTAVTARAQYASTEIAEKMQTYMNGLEVSYKDGFEAPVITDYIIEKQNTEASEPAESAD